MSIIDYLGEQLIEHDQIDQKNIKIIETKQLTNKYVGFYFSAHWCPPCRNFTPKLAEFYKNSFEQIENQFDLVFISLDEDQSTFDEYFHEMPWKALSFSDRERSKVLGEKFDIEGIPSLIVFSPSGEIITKDGVEEIQEIQEKIFQKWIQGKSLFWSLENKSNEYSWNGIHCSLCFMRPIIGSRFHDQNEQSTMNLCQECASKKASPNNLIKYLTPKMIYSIDQIFQSVPYLIQPNSEEQISTNSLWENHVKTIGIYFSAHWCPPCRSFTPKLAEIYKETQIDLTSSFRLLFVSCDRDEKSFHEYHSSMLWPAVPFQNGSILKAYFKFSSIPSLIIISSDGKILTRRGRDDISRKGIEAIQAWSKGELLAPPLPDEYQWSGVSCDGCQIFPIIGHRYHCSTCGNYDLCSNCQIKGHEHSLELISPPNHDKDD